MYNYNVYTRTLKKSEKIFRFFYLKVLHTSKVMLIFDSTKTISHENSNYFTNKRKIN